ncbi:NAD(P)H dehydrogenase [quinone] 1 isoform X2 [Epinephelus lanceolatus]
MSPRHHGAEGEHHRVYKSHQEPGLRRRRIQQTHSMAQKTALIVYAHQSLGSFNSAVRDVATEELAAQGYKVLVSDLYAMNFRANATQDDIIGDLKNPELFQYGEETMHAWMDGRLSDDIVAEQRKVEEAELVIFQFPLYWFSVPAIMKGWMDRVLTQGFAFSLEKMYNYGVFKDKKAMLSFTTGATQTMFHPDGINGDINITLWPLQNGTLHFCGFQVLAPQIFWSPAHCPPAVRKMMLDGWRARLKGLLAEKPLTFAPCELFDLSFQGGFKLWPKVKEEQESQPYGITTGHHLGKPLPPDNQITAPPDNHITAPPSDQSSASPACRK